MYFDVYRQGPMGFLNNVIQGNFNVYTIVPSLNLTSFPTKRKEG